MIEIEIRLFNSLQKYHLDRLRLQRGSTVGDALCLLAIPDGEIYLTLLNGRNIMRSPPFSIAYNDRKRQHIPVLQETHT